MERGDEHPGRAGSGAAARLQRSTRGVLAWGQQDSLSWRVQSCPTGAVLAPAPAGDSRDEVMHSPSRRAVQAAGAGRSHSRSRDVLPEGLTTVAADRSMPGSHFCHIMQSSPILGI